MHYKKSIFLLVLLSLIISLFYIISLDLTNGQQDPKSRLNLPAIEGPFYAYSDNFSDKLGWDYIDLGWLYFFDNGWVYSANKDNYIYLKIETSHLPIINGWHFMKSRWVHIFPNNWAYFQEVQSECYSSWSECKNNRQTRNIILSKSLECNTYTNKCFDRGTISGETPLIKHDGKCFITEDGRPFFAIADTAWLLGRLSNADIEHYIKIRSEQGFNVIKFDAREGDLSKHDFIFDTLKKYNMYAETGPDVSQISGKNYVNRYKSRDNIFAWTAGGLDDGSSLNIVNNLIDIFKSLDSKHMISAHPKSGRSLISSHGISSSKISFDSIHKCNPGSIKSLFLNLHGLPSYLIEPVYEGRYNGCGCSNGCSADQALSQISEAINLGFAGISYGHHSVWSFNLGLSSWGVDPSNKGTPWKQALNSPGAIGVSQLVKGITGGNPELSRSC
jgi:hypothetical protein